MRQWMIAVLGLCLLGGASQAESPPQGPPPPPSVEETLFHSGESHRHGWYQQKRNIKEALAAHRRAADMGHVPSMVAAGEILHQERHAGITPDYDAAFGYFERAAQSGNGMSMLYLAAFHDAGLSENLQPSRHTAMQWIQRAEEAGVGDRQVLYQEVFYRTVLPRDASEAAIAAWYDWSLMSWEAGLDYGHATLGARRREGVINIISFRMRSDPELLSSILKPHHERLFRLLAHEDSRAEHGTDTSCDIVRDVHYLLGLFHMNGWGGTRKNDWLAELFLTLAADNGHEKAKQALDRYR